MPDSAHPSTVSRRLFLRSTLGSGLTLATATQDSKASPDNITRRSQPTYPRVLVARASILRLSEPVYFTYPDTQSPCLAVKLGRRAIGGAGASEDIVAYSIMCTHMGCALSYEAHTARLKCGCHFSMFDPERSGQMIVGQATSRLPQILLQYTVETDEIHAVGVEGLIYGRQSNLIDAS